jgi:DNA-binding NarL/FixJ family response regulator
MFSNDASAAADPVRVMIVDDHASVRQLLSFYLTKDTGFSIVAEAADTDEALRLGALHRPQVVVLDWMLRGGTGLKYLREGLSGENPPRVLVFSSDTSDGAVRDALNNGAKGYLEKTAALSEFTAAITAVAEGRVYLSAEIEQAVHRMSCQPQTMEVTSELSDREVEVLKLVAEGMSSKDIATLLGISVRTVGSHRARISQKTGLTSIAQFTLHAVRLGLTQQPATVTAGHVGAEAVV